MDHPIPGQVGVGIKTDDVDAAAHAIEPARTAFFEDRAMNLKPAAALGMTTVLVGSHAAANADEFVRHRTPRLAPFLAAAQVKERP